jgi:hypothetical protein
MRKMWLTKLRSRPSVASLLAMRMKQRSLSAKRFSSRSLSLPQNSAMLGTPK